jgi:hypothetical protein
MRKTMTTKREASISMTCNQMMKSGQGGRPKIDKHVQERFKEEHRRSIEWAIDHLPRCSSAVIAVVVKCILKHSKEEILPFCDKMKNELFDGVNDPTYLLWSWLMRNKGANPTHVYKRTVTATRACMEGRTISEIRPSKTDIFNWDEDYQSPFESDEATEELNSPWIDLEDQVDHVEEKFHAVKRLMKKTLVQYRKKEPCIGSWHEANELDKELEEAEDLIKNINQWQNNTIYLKNKQPQK